MCTTLDHRLYNRVYHTPAHALYNHVYHTPAHALYNHVYHTPAHRPYNHVYHTPDHRLYNRVYHTRDHSLESCVPQTLTEKKTSVLRHKLKSLGNHFSEKQSESDNFYSKCGALAWYRPNLNICFCKFLFKFIGDYCCKHFKSCSAELKSCLFAVSCVTGCKQKSAAKYISKDSS